MKKLLFAAAVLVTGVGFAEFSSDTLAFYPFTDGEAGADANGVTLVNAADPGTHDAAGVAYKYSGTTAQGVIRFDDDVPGAYLFDDVTPLLPTPICSNLRSILMTTDVTDPATAPANAAYSGGYISLPDISTELSKCGTSGFTVEFFWKIPTEEPYPCSYAGALTLDIGITDGASAAKKLSVAFPLGTPTDSGYGKQLAIFTTPWGNRAQYPSSIAYGEWHHLALTFANGTFTVVGDYQYSAQQTGLTVSEIETAKEIKLGFRYDNAYAGFHGKIAGLRFTKRALASADFLRASDNSRYRNARDPEPLSVDANTIAFYSFKEGVGRVGEETGDVVLLNDVANDHVGVCAKAGGVFPAYSNDAPGPYLFNGYREDGAAFCTNAMSLFFAGGKVDFDAVGTALSKLDESTIEFYWKMDPAEPIVGWAATMAWDAGYLRSGNAYPLSLILPLANQESAAYGKDVRLVKKGAVSPSDGFGITKTYEAFPDDGLWHHLAVTYKNGTVEFYTDHWKVGSGDGFTREELAASVPFELGCGKYRGKISCLRISKKALAPEEMLFASTVPTCLPKEHIRLRLNGTVGVNADSSNLPNVALNYVYANTNIYCSSASQSFPSASRVNGTGLTSKSDTIWPVFSSMKWWTGVRESQTAEAVDNGTSVYFCTEPKGSASDIFASGPSVRVYSGLDASMTVEAFVKFDYNGFWSRIGSLWEESRNRVTLLAESKSGVARWNLHIDNAQSETAAALKLEAICTNDTSKTLSASWTIGRAIRNRWHHFAVVYDKESPSIAVYCDYEPVINLQLPAPLALEECNMFSFAGGANNQPFDGWIDEYRVTRGILGTDEFLRPDGRPGVMLFVR